MASMIRALSNELGLDNMAKYEPGVLSPVYIRPYPAPRINNENRLHSREHLKK